MTSSTEDLIARMLDDLGIPSDERADLAAVLERHDAANRHLGHVLYFISDLHPDDRNEAIDEALAFYNAQNPTLQVHPSDHPAQRLVDDNAAPELPELVAPAGPPPDSDLAARFEQLRAAYAQLQDRNALLEAASSVKFGELGAARLELASWAAAEAERWLDPRAGGGADDKFGQRLQKIAALLAILPPEISA